MQWLLLACRQMLRLGLHAFDVAQVDLNRDFPDQFQRGTAGVAEPSGSEQPETLALMHWIRHGSFVASASLHEVWLPCPGALQLLSSNSHTHSDVYLAIHQPGIENANMKLHACPF